MKKRVAVILVISLLAMGVLVFNGANKITGMQGFDVSDLPKPPTPLDLDIEGEVPDDNGEDADDSFFDFDEDEEEDYPEETTDAADMLDDIEDSVDGSFEARLEDVEEKIKVVQLMPEFEERLNDVELQVAIATDTSTRLDSVESRLDSMSANMKNIKEFSQKPFVDKPTVTKYFDNAMSAIRASKANAVLGITLSVIALIIVIGLVATYIVNRRHEYEEEKEIISEYFENYQKAGYKPEQLRMHLKAVGWNDKIIDEAMKKSK